MTTEVEVGKTYKIRSDRKGTFVARITMINDVWVTGVLVSGKAGAMLKENEVYVGEEVTLRRSFCSFDQIVS